MSTDTQNQILTDLKTFLHFVCEEKTCPVDNLVDSCLSLLQNCPSSREAVLQFFAKLMDEYCSEYCVRNSMNFSQSDDRAVDDRAVGPIISRLILAQKNSSNSNVSSNEFMSVRKLSTDSQRHSTENRDSDHKSSQSLDCPQSPTAGTSASIDPLNDMKTTSDHNSDWNAVMTALDFQFIRISESLLSLIKSENNSFSKSITDWSLELAANLSAKYGQFCETAVSPLNQSSDLNVSLSSSLAFWMQCPAMQALTNLTISSNSIELERLVKQMLQYSPHCDWILAHLITTMSNNSGFTAYIEQLIQSASTSPSVTCILSYLSEHNPRAIVNCSKSNLPFLLKLSTNSKPLLDLLVTEATKKCKTFDFDINFHIFNVFNFAVNIKALNELVLTTKAEELNDHIIYCITNADNAFDLLKLAFDITVHTEANEELKSRTLILLSSIVSHIHEFIYGSKLTLTNCPPIMDLLKNNIQKLVFNSVKTTNPCLRRLQLRLLNLLCLHYGTEFVTEVFHYILSTPTNGIDYNSFRTPIPNPLLNPIMKSLRLQFGTKVQNCLSNTLNLPFDKSVHYWFHLLASVEAESVCLNIDLLCSFFSGHNFEKKTKIFIKYYILRLLLHTMEKFPKRVVRPQHRLCLSLVSTYFQIIKLQQNCLDSELDVFMETLVTCQRSMSHLAKNYQINQFILTRILLELSIENNKLFSKNLNQSKPNKKDATFKSVSLLNENKSYDLVNSKFRKIPLIPGKPDLNSSGIVLEDEMLIVNQQLILDAFQCCVRTDETASFARLLVQIVSPDLLFNDNLWPDDDPTIGQSQHLRVLLLSH